MSRASPARQKLGAFVIQAGFGLAVLVWIGVAWLSIRQTPGWEGILTGVFVGFFMALLTALGGAMAAVAIGRGKKPAPPEDNRPLEATLDKTLAELEAIRRRTAKQIHARAIFLVPFCAALGAGVWKLTQASDDPADPGDIYAFIAVGGFLGYGWAAHALVSGYERLYKGRVLPLLARQFGDLSWRRAQAPLDEIRRHRLFEFDDAHAEDEIHGAYRGMPLSIVELRLTRGSGKNRRTVFHGLLVKVALPRGLRGVTTIVGDKGPFGQVLEHLPGGRASQRVRVEDPEFERLYEVYGTDQIGARALLTPAFMTRFLELARSGRFGAPLVLAQDNQLMLALPRMGGDLFEPPSWYRPAGARDAIRQMTADLKSVLSAADAVIDLDFAARAHVQGDREAVEGASPAP